MREYVGAFDVDRAIKDLSVEVSATCEQRALVSLSIGVEEDKALEAATDLLEVLRDLRSDLGVRLELADLLEGPRAEYLRSIYFAQAGRGIGLAVENLEWLVGHLRTRVEIVEWIAASGGARLPARQRYISWGKPLLFEVDRGRIGCGVSLSEIPRLEGGLCSYDIGLIECSLKRDVSPLLRAMCCLSVGVGFEDMVYCVSGLLEALDEFRASGWCGRTRVGEILSGPFDDYQRALFFACAGREWGDVYRSLGSLREIACARVELANENKMAGIDGGKRVSPYVKAGAPEALLFKSVSDQAARYSA